MGRRARATTEVTARRLRLASPRTAVALGALTLVLFALGVLLGFAAHGGGGGLGLAALLIGVLGLVVARRQPGNPIGWLLMGFGATTAFYGDVGAYAVLDYHFHHGNLPLGPAAALAASELWILIFLVLPLVVVLFPDGRLPSRWRMVLWVYLAICALLVAALLGFGAWDMAGTPIVVTGKGQLVNNPGPAGAAGIAFVILLGAVPVFWASFVARQVLSWRRASGERRAQLKWLMAGSTLTVAGLAGGFVFGTSSFPLATVLSNVSLVLGVFSLPVSIGIGILKYHLYDIDRIISRTLAYAIVTGLLIGVYAGIVLLATRVLPLASSVAVASATLAAAALFNPLRRRVQRMVDRQFNRARYDADKTMAAFAARLQDAVDLDSVRDDLTGVVTKTLEPAHVSVWISQRG
ncbi:MAG TPA: hypothetical protein VIX86_20300 [Streptosporangiaceae bacterium]